MMRNALRVGATLLALLVGIVGCGDDDDDGGGGPFDCAWCNDTPEAIAADDNRPSGVYKGVLTGDDSTGTTKATELGGLVGCDLGLARARARRSPRGSRGHQHPGPDRADTASGPRPAA